MAISVVPSSASSSITVVVRVRPFTAKEAAQLTKSDDNPLFLGDGSLAHAPLPRLNQRGLRSVIKVVDDRCLVFDPPEDSPLQKFSRSVVPQGKKVKDQTFAFDRVFDSVTSQQDVYEASTRGLLDNVLDGYNATVFAYGATGCGKTHTITGTAEQPGIIFLAMQELFERIQDLQGEKVTEISLSYLEIYNETIRDLLVPGGSKQPLSLREDANHTVSVPGLSSHRPQNVQEVMDMIIRGNEYRTMSPTEANATSSRSHAVLQINVSQKDRNADINEPHTMATLSIIDLAGSERASATKNRGDRLLEGANINKSLLALGSCINALCDTRRKQHVPYRNSKLTRLLKFSLGGNCKTVMIVCVSPSSAHFDETQNTLRYANRAKNIQTKVSRNVFNVNRHVKDFLKKINEQMTMIEELKAQQRDYEAVAFGKFQKLVAKKEGVLREGITRLRAVGKDERAERITLAGRLRQAERRIGVISAWMGAAEGAGVSGSDRLHEDRLAGAAMLAELEASRQHLQRRLADADAAWDRVVESAFTTGERQLRELDPASGSETEIQSLRREADLVRAEADRDKQEAVADSGKNGLAADAVVIQELVGALLHSASALSGMQSAATHQTDGAAIAEAKRALASLAKECTSAASRVIGDDGERATLKRMSLSNGGLTGLSSYPSLLTPKRSTPRRKMSEGVSVSPAKLVLTRNTGGNFASSDPSSSPAKVSSPAVGSPRRWRARKPNIGTSSVLTPKKKAKKRGVRWRDDEDGHLADYNSPDKGFGGDGDDDSWEGIDSEDAVDDGVAAPRSAQLEGAGSTPSAVRTAVPILTVTDFHGEGGGDDGDDGKADGRVWPLRNMDVDSAEDSILANVPESKPRASLASSSRFQTGFLSKRPSDGAGLGSVNGQSSNAVQPQLQSTFSAFANSPSPPPPPTSSIAANSNGPGNSLNGPPSSSSPSAIPVHVRSLRRLASSDSDRGSLSGLGLGVPSLGAGRSRRVVSAETSGLSGASKLGLSNGSGGDKDDGAGTGNSSAAGPSRSNLALARSSVGPDAMRDLERVFRRTSLHGSLRAKKMQRRRSSGTPAALLGTGGAGGAGPSPAPGPGGAVGSGSGAAGASGNGGGPVGGSVATPSFSIHNLRRINRAAEAEWKTASVLSPRPGIIKQGGRRTTVGGGGLGAVGGGVTGAGGGRLGASGGAGAGAGAVGHASPSRAGMGYGSLRERRSRHSILPGSMASGVGPVSGASDGGEAGSASSRDKLMTRGPMRMSSAGTGRASLMPVKSVWR